MSIPNRRPPLEYKSWLSYVVAFCETNATPATMADETLRIGDVKAAAKAEVNEIRELLTEIRNVMRGGWMPGADQESELFDKVERLIERLG